MTPIRRAALLFQYEKVEALIAQAGSVRAAAKREGMDRANFQALRRTLREKTRILTTSAAADTK
jgi:hypothetical protein